MTIVLASIADKGNALIMASDRMLARAHLTYQFEHDSPNIRSLGSYLVGYAGATTFADDIMSHKYHLDGKTMQEFIEEFSAFYVKYGNRIASRVLLESLGLDLATFNKNPGMYPPPVQQRVYDRLGSAKLNVEFIVCGFDENQPKIYVVGEYGVFSTAHSIGHAAIGIGEPHAAHFYMVNGFKFNTPLKEAIYFAYQAKKGAEIAGGVGQCTDIYVLERGTPAVSYHDGSTFIRMLNIIYEKHRQQMRKLYERNTVPQLEKLRLEATNEPS
ncbi:MAG: hypothetical protein HYY01_12480 [Chloroflexi bacterium]|nr:hypothetical protein [Chloroflexota bacterium]